MTTLQEKLEERHSSLSGAEVEVSGADVSIENEKKNVFVLLSLVFDIVLDGEKEDKTKAVEVLKLDMDEEKRDKILCSWEDTEVSAGTYQGYIVRFHTNPYNEVNLDYAEL